MAVKTNPIFANAVMDSDNEKAFEQIYYFLFEPKGILVIGNVGSGKTYLMEFYSAVLTGTLMYYRIVQSNWVIRDCIADINRIDDYGRTAFIKNVGEDARPITFCFDDLGMEQSEAKVYGNSISILTDILFDRHLMFKKNGMKTHATSNLSVDAIAEKYADRAASRFREMFNVVVLDSPDRRK